MLHKLLDKLVVSSGNHRFARLVKNGLTIVDVDAVRLDWEDRDRLALLCRCNSKIYAVVSNNFNVVSAMSAIGHKLDVKRGFAGRNVECSYCLDGEIYRLPLVVIREWR